MYHVEFGDYFDITIPTIERPERRTIQVTPYGPETACLLNVLTEAVSELGDYFAEQDGRLYLVAYCRKLPAWWLVVRKL